MSPAEPFRDLHDALLKGVEMDWEAGDLAFVVHRIGAERQARLIIGGVTSFKMDRHLPWGPSVHIYSAQVAALPGADGGFTVEIQMQSGDVIAIEGVAAREEPWAG